MSGKGKLIVFEGVEGCGKTTQLQKSLMWLQSLHDSEKVDGSFMNSELNALAQEAGSAAQRFGGNPPPESKLSESSPADTPPPYGVIVTNEPGGTELGHRLRQLLLKKAGGNKIQDTAELLLFAADRAQHVEEVLKPQLALGKMILCDRYTDSTIAYQGYGRGLSLSLIEQLNTIATGGLKSDLTLWLDIDVEVGLARKRGKEPLDRIEQADLAFHRRVQQGYTELAKAHPERIIRVDASKSEELVQEQIRAILHSFKC